MSYKKTLGLKLKCVNYTIGIKGIKTDGVKLMGWLYSGWDSSLLKYDGEDFLDEMSSV
jgi:hypothetical protein